MFARSIFLLCDTSEQRRTAQPRGWLPIFQIPFASFHISSESKQSLPGSVWSCSYTFPPFCNSFTHLTSHSCYYLVLRHQFSHRITKAWCIKIFNKPQGTVISVTAISVSTEMQPYAQIYFKSLTSKVSLRYRSLSAIIVIGRKPAWECFESFLGGGGKQERRKRGQRERRKEVVFVFYKESLLNYLFTENKLIV